METLRSTQVRTLLRALKAPVRPQSSIGPARLFSSSRASRKNPSSTLFNIFNRPCPQAWKSQAFRRVSRKGYSSSPNPTPNLGSPPATSLSQRLRKLSREYGWSALGVYLALSALDFPFCFLAVRWLGTDRIGHWEHVVIEYFWKIIPYPFPEKKQQATLSTEASGSATGAEGDVALETASGWGVEAAEEANNSSQASIWTQLALAYAIHKSFIFVRVPLTAAVTPKVVKVLRGWGWDIGKRKPKIKS